MAPLGTAATHRFDHALVHPERAAAKEVAAFARWLVEEFTRGPQRLG